MTEERSQKSIVIIIAAILTGGFILLAGLDTFLDLPLVLVLWAAVGLCATALAHLISLIIYLITKKDRLPGLRLLCPAVLTAAAIIWAWRENKEFMGSIGAAVITVQFVIPLGATFLFWLSAAIFRVLRSQK